MTNGKTRSRINDEDGIGLVHPQFFADFAINWAMLRPRVEKTVNGNNFLSLTRWRQRFAVTDGHWSLTRAPQL
jgi:hypothetical protein